MSNSNQNSPEYNKIKLAGSWSTWLIWLQILLLPAVILLPYYLNQKTITLGTFLATSVLNLALIIPLIIILVIKGEPLKHPENLSVQQIGRDITWIIWVTLMVTGVDLLNGGRVGLIWILFIVTIAQAKRAVNSLERHAVQHITQ